jgi:hypothetical protein
MVVSGCGSVHPGSAAVVGSQSISHAEVDDVAAALCSANLESAKAQGQAAQALPTRGVREGALQILLETELNQQFGEARGVAANKQQVSQAVQQNAQGIALLPADQQEDFRTALAGYAEGQLMLIEVGREALGADATDDEAIAEGTRLRGPFVDSLDVEVDPATARSRTAPSSAAHGPLGRRLQPGTGRRARQPAGRLRLHAARLPAVQLIFLVTSSRVARG